jgi:SAM-dependent methyltransferase
MTHSAKQIESDIARWSCEMSPEARYYWERHQPRYTYLIELLEELRKHHSFERILDVGMGFETVLLSKLFSESRVDCLGAYEDERFRPLNNFAFYKVDLNDVATEANVCQACAGKYDLIVFMEVLEHLYTPPDIVLRYLASLLRDGGIIIATTPNAVWLKNRLKMLLGKNPFELLRANRTDMGHIREYTQTELSKVLSDSGLTKLVLESRGLYRFNNLKDNCYSFIADFTFPSLRRSLVAVAQKNFPKKL